MIAQRRLETSLKSAFYVLAMGAVALLAWRSYLDGSGQDGKALLAGWSAWNAGIDPYTHTAMGDYNQAPAMTLIGGLAVRLGADAQALGVVVILSAIACAHLVCVIGRISRWWSLLLIAGAIPLLEVVRMTNATAPVAALLMVGVACVDRRAVIAGVAVGTSIAMKPLGLAVLGWFLLRGSHRATGAAVLTGLGLTLCSIDLLAPWLEAMHEWAPRWRGAPYNYALLGSLPATPWVVVVSSLGACAAARIERCARARELAIAPAIALASSVVASPVVWNYTMILVLPIVAILPALVRHAQLARRGVIGGDLCLRRSFSG